jgi:hypothetical protein
LQAHERASSVEAAELAPADALAAAAFALACRFATGATMWCCAPQWPEHARHVAVEFVHPVIMGTRALPAAAIAGPDPVGALRACARPGDVVVLVGVASDPAIADVVRRGAAWGVTTVWIGCGAPAGATAADYSLGIDTPPGSARFDGSVVRLYHLLWELTHVCFVHPGLLRVDDGCDDEVCITCSDEGRAAEVVHADGAEALVRTARGLERVDVSLVAPVDVDDLVLVHAGAAIASLGEAP